MLSRLRSEAKSLVVDLDPLGDPLSENKEDFPASDANAKAELARTQ